MHSEIKGLIEFLKTSASAFHAVKNVCDILDESGYVRLQEGQCWKLEKGGKYYVTRNQSAVIAFNIPECGFAPINAVASHSDSPVFRIKQHPELTVQGKYTLLNTERYGGMIMNTWMDRPLSVAGRVMVREGGRIESRLINIDRDLLMIPNLAIHMNREMNDGVKLNAQVDTLPLYGDIAAKDSFNALIAGEAGAAPEQIVGSDLYIYNRMQPSLWGKDDCYISAARLDDLECVYTSLRAFLSAKAGEHINMCCVFDNEEVGSGTRQGADSTFFEDVIIRTAHAMDVDADRLRAALASSFLLSADNAHALHPNHPEKADAVNRPCMNEGIVVKFSANQKYTTDGVSNAVFATICEKAGVPVQYYHNRSDIIGGSTLGNISTAHISVRSVDIGLAQLAMHSSYETAGAKDVLHMIEGIKAFYNAEIRENADGMIEIN